MRNRDPLLQAANRLNRSAPQGERLAYVNPAEENLMKAFGGSGRSVNGIPSYQPAMKDYSEAMREGMETQLAMVTGKPVGGPTGVDYSDILPKGLESIVDAERPGRLAAAQLDTDVLKRTLLGGEGRRAEADGSLIIGYKDPPPTTGGEKTYQLVPYSRYKVGDDWSLGGDRHGVKLLDSDGNELLREERKGWDNRRAWDQSQAIDRIFQAYLDEKPGNIFEKAVEAGYMERHHVTKARGSENLDKFIIQPDSPLTEREPEYQTAVDPETGKDVIHNDEFRAKHGMEPRGGRNVRGEGLIDLYGPKGATSVYNPETGERESVSRAGFRRDPLSGKEEFQGVTTYEADVAEQLARRKRGADIADVEELGTRATDAYRAQGDIQGALDTARALGPGGVEAPSAVPGDIFAGIAQRPPAVEAPADDAAPVAGEGTIYTPASGGRQLVGRQRPQDGAAQPEIPADVNALMKANPEITDQMFAEENSGLGVSWDQGEGRKAEFMRRLTGAGDVQGPPLSASPVGEVQGPPAAAAPAAAAPAAGAAAPADMTYLQAIAREGDFGPAEKLRGSYDEVTGGRIGGAFDPFSLGAAAAGSGAAADLPVSPFEDWDVDKAYGDDWFHGKTADEFDDMVGRQPSGEESRWLRGGEYDPTAQPAAAQPATAQRGERAKSTQPTRAYSAIDDKRGRYLAEQRWEETDPQRAAELKMQASGQFDQLGQQAQPAGAAAMQYGTDPLRRSLMMEAQEGLGAGLTERERRNIQQASRSRATAMGRTFDPTATIDEFKQQLLEDRNRQAINRAFGQSVLGQEVGIQEGDLARSLQAQGINLQADLGAGQFDIGAEIDRKESQAGRELGAAESDAERAFRMATTGEQLRQSGLAAERGAAANLVGLEQTTSADPFESILARSSGAGAGLGQQVMGTAQYGLGSGPQFITPQTSLGYQSAQDASAASAWGMGQQAQAAKSAGKKSMLGGLLGGALGMFNIDID